MDRMTDTNIPAARRDRDEDGYPDASYSEAVHTCESCGATAERLSTMPAYLLSPELQACDTCMEEDVAARAVDYRAVAISAIRKEAARVMQADAGCTAEEITAYESHFGEVA